MAGATSQINASSRRNVETSQMQLSAVQETTTSATELQETARVAGERAREIQTALASTAESGQSIKVQLGEATELLGRAREELLAIVGSVQDLSGRNQQIGEIIESVSDVADQTQLLAVNAAIEAAKAGEVGRGFGVVATEMKALAEQSKKSAQRIRSIVGEVQRATADTVRQVETGQARLQEALDPVSAILPKIDRLTVQVDESGQSGRQIVAIVAQQGAGVEQISQAMKSINGGVQEGLAQTQQVERAAESLNLLAAKLRDNVAGYRV
jgi:methyl-accepting chemotaxis protein